MLSHRNIIFVFLIIILIIVLILQNNKKNTKETFISNPKFIDYIYGLNRNNDERCMRDFTKLDLEKNKNYLVNSRLCYSKKESLPNSKPKYKPNSIGIFINKLFLEKPKDNDINDSGNVTENQEYVTSKSDYLGCYRWAGKTNKDGLKEDGKYFHPLPNNKEIKDGENGNFMTLRQAKNKINNAKIFMSGEIRDEMNKMESKVQVNGETQYKSVAGKLTEKQFSELKKYRVPDKYCLGRKDLNNNFTIKNYLGGVGTVSIYKNGTELAVQDEPKLFVRDQVISVKDSCVENISLECISEFRKHVLADFNFVHLYEIDATDFDTKHINISKFKEIQPEKIDKLFMDNSKTHHRLAFIDYSGNENHMILDYNYLNFLGVFDLRYYFDNMKKYSDWLTDPEIWKKESTDNIFMNDERYKLSQNNRLIFSRYKDIYTTNKAKYFITDVGFELLKKNGNKINFCENYNDNIIKLNSHVMRGRHNLWPFIGMIGWWDDKTEYKNITDENHPDIHKPIVVKGQISGKDEGLDKNRCGKRIEFKNIEGTFPGLRKAFDLSVFGSQVPVAGKTNYEADERVYWLQNSDHDPTFVKHYDHNCNCYGNKHRGWDCDHLSCLNYSYMKDIHHFENPNPLYVSISQTQTRKNLRYFNFEKDDTLTLETIPSQDVSGDPQMESITPVEDRNGNNKTKNCNKFFMRGSNRFMKNLRDEYVFIFNTDRSKSIARNQKDSSISENPYSKSNMKNKNGCLLKYEDNLSFNLAGNPIISISSNFKNKYDKNEIKFYPSEDEGNEEETTSNNSFLWSYVHDYPMRDNSFRDGLLYTIPKKVYSIGFAPRGKRLCISKITIYNKEGKVINSYLEPKNNNPGEAIIINNKKYIRKNNLKLYRKDEFFAYDPEKYIIDHKEFENRDNIEKSFCFTSNPISFIKRYHMWGEKINLGELYGRSKNNVNSNKKAYEYIGCYANTVTLETRCEGDDLLGFRGRIGNLRNGNNSAIETRKKQDGSLSSKRYFQDQNMPSKHIGIKTIDQCESSTVEKGYKYFGMEYPQGSGPNSRKAECLPLPEIPGLFTDRPCDTKGGPPTGRNYLKSCIGRPDGNYRLLPDGTCEDNKYFYRRPESECSIRNYMDGNNPLGSGVRLSLYEVTANAYDNPAPPIPINQSGDKNGGLIGDEFEMDQIGNLGLNNSNNTFIPLKRNQIKAVGKNHIFISPLNERLKKDGIWNGYRHQMGRIYKEVEVQEIIKEGDAPAQTITKINIVEDQNHTNDSGKITGWKPLPFSVKPKKPINDGDAFTPQYEAFLQLHESSNNPSDSRYGQSFFPKLKIPPTDGDKDFYLLKLNKPDYISRIVIECGIKEAVTKMSEIDDKNNSFYESTINSIIKDQFENTIMFLYDEDNTNDILYTDGGKEKIVKNFDYTKVDNINNTRLSTLHVNHQNYPKVEKEFQDKTATIDFYNIGFIGDRIVKNNYQDGQTKSVAIVCEEKNSSEKYLYFKYCFNENDNVFTSDKLIIPNDFLETTNKNYNYKIGNLFDSFSDVKLKNLMILGKSFFVDRRKSRKPDGYNNIDEYLPDKTLNKILINMRKSNKEKNQYSAVSNKIKEVIKPNGSKFRKEMNITKIFDTTSNEDINIVNVPGNFIKYETAKSDGFETLYNDPNESRDTIIDNMLFSPKRKPTP